MNQFSINRFCQVVKWDFMNEWRRDLWEFLGLVVIFTLVLLGIDVFQGPYNEILRPSIMEAKVVVCMFIYSFYIYVSTSKLCDPLKEKQSATALLSLPASIGEKYLSRLVNTLIFGIVAGALAFVCADLLQMGVVSMTNSQAVLSGSIIVAGKLSRMSSAFKATQAGPYLSIAFVLANLLGLSIYMFGSAFFRKRQFWMTTFALFVISIVLSMGIFSFAIYYDEHLDFMEKLGNYIDNWVNTHFDSPEELAKFLLQWGCGILALLTGLFTWGSYRLFKRAQVINTKWISL